MKRIKVVEENEWVMEVTDEEYHELIDGNVYITDLLEKKENTGDIYWKNGVTEWY